MKTTREAAIKSCKDRLEHLENAPSHHCGKRQRQRAIELEKVKIEALRPITREQVERMWRGRWIAYLDGEHIMPERYYSCSKCGGRGHLSKRNFCDFCGAPMTDAAVDMVMERLEVMKDGNSVKR